MFSIMYVCEAVTYLLSPTSICIVFWMMLLIQNTDVFEKGNWVLIKKSGYETTVFPIPRTNVKCFIMLF